MELKLLINEQDFAGKIIGDKIGDLNLTSAFLYEIKNLALEKATEDIKNQLSAWQGYDTKEIFLREITEELLKRVDGHINKTIADRLTDSSLEEKIDRIVNRVMGSWIESKAYEKLEQVKLDIAIVSGAELKEEQEAAKAEANDAYKQGREDGSRE